MERVLNIHIEKLPEGVYLATSDSIQGLVAQGRTVSETLEIARDVARKLIEAREEKKAAFGLPIVGDTFDYPLVIGVRCGPVGRFRLSPNRKKTKKVRFLFRPSGGG
uniref:DUF1902 domain-containing protein n=2 Tax=unclassified Candidatus Kentrum TaxID=2643149 RepID=A0A450RYS1_9GAMM|nr:MAG: hypothetical protein BECKFM1743A_GA0114220_1001014 [Candidatus Kentron sp. FM]VFJ44387.1 MAG: hypothetical protein BECKFM1743C_GA0114222_1001013 [Candidatus Kentron sp. FM]VFK06264.1 MAG: hypothetical protein BECKFM1743B_GA0114221_1001314 [Candidatus Kentron sp. FM]